MELDSSTPAKFSRHLLVRVPGAAFASNFHAGAFVQSLLEPQPCADPQPAPQSEEQLAERSAGHGTAVASGPTASAGALHAAAEAGPSRLAAIAVEAAEATAAAHRPQVGSNCSQPPVSGSGPCFEAHGAAVGCSRQSPGSDHRVQAAHCGSGPHGASPDEGACGSAGLQGTPGSTEPGSGASGAAPAGVLQAAGSADVCGGSAADADAAAFGTLGADTASLCPSHLCGAASCKDGASCTAEGGMGESGPNATDPHPSQQPEAGRSVDGVHVMTDARPHEQLLVTKVCSCYISVLGKCLFRRLLALTSEQQRISTRWSWSFRKVMGMCRRPQGECVST